MIIAPVWPEVAEMSAEGDGEEDGTSDLYSRMRLGVREEGENRKEEIVQCWSSYYTVYTICLGHYNSLGQWDAMGSNHLQFLYKLAHMFDYILGVVLNIYSLIAAINCHLLYVI